MTPREYTVTLVTPAGEEIDLTDRIAELGTATAELDEELLQITAADWDVTLVDTDGFVAGLLAGAAATDRYHIRVDRETVRRRPKIERVFGGVLDLPYSVVRDRKRGLISFQAFSYLKLLETTAEVVRRDLTGRYANTTASSAVVSFSDTTDLAPGDEITLRVGSTSESGTISTVDSGTQVTCEGIWSNTFEFASVTVDTPYHRDRSISFLLGALLDEAGIDTRTVEMRDGGIATVPLASHVAAGALGAGAPRALFPFIPFGETTRWLYMTMSTDGESRAANMIDGFDDFSAVTTGKIDWTPYFTIQPNTLQDAASSGDDGTRAADHVNSYVWSLAWVTVGNDKLLKLYRDAVEQATVTTVVGYVSVQWAAGPMGVEYNPATSNIWVSANWTLAASYVPDGTTKIWNGASFTTLWDGYGGSVRHVAPLGIMLVQNHLHFTDPDGAGELRFYRAADSALLHTKRARPFYRMWTARAFADRFLAIVYEYGTTTRIVVYRTDDTEYPLVVDSLLDNATDTDVFATRWVNEYDEEHYVVSVGRRIYVLAGYFAGVVHYADFDGMSCGAAVRELALLTGSYLTVDQYGSLTLTNRSAKFLAEPRDIPRILDRQTVPMSNRYVRSVEVTGEDENGDKIEVIVGDTGDSKHRLEIDGQLIQTPLTAYAVAAGYLSFFNVLRSTEEVEVEDDPHEEPIEVLDVVRLDDEPFLVTQVESDYEDDTQLLSLMEL